MRNKMYDLLLSAVTAAVIFGIVLWKWTADSQHSLQSMTPEMTAILAICWLVTTGYLHRLIRPR